MRFLLDANVVFTLDPLDASSVEHGLTDAATLHRRAVEHGHDVVLHPALRSDVERDTDHQRRSARKAVLRKYTFLAAGPSPSAALVEAFGAPATHTNDWVDLQHAAAVEAGAVDWLVTADRGLARRATRAGLGGRVFDVVGALELVARLHPPARRPPTAVDVVPAYALDLRLPFFDSLREDYDGFDAWWHEKCAKEHRTCLVVRQAGELAGLCVLKPERGEVPPTMKLCTLKVDEAFSGSRYGELLLRGAFERTRGARLPSCYVDAYEKHDGLLRLLTALGFEVLQTRHSGELRLRKALEPLADDPPLGALEHHIRYGPGALPPDPPAVLLVPVTPAWHSRLFPDDETQMSLFNPAAVGNAVRKAYLCNAPLRNVLPGAVLFFYRSGHGSAITNVGVVERRLVSSDPDEIVRAVGKRTVYSYEEITAMCARREVLAVLFRHDRRLVPGVSSAELTQGLVTFRAPQAMQNARPEVAEWMMARASR